MIERSEIQFGTTRIPFQIQRSDRRATVALAIDGGKLVVTAPARATIERLNAVVRGKAFWVKQRLGSNRTPPPFPAREFVSGETFRYLGRQYRLRVLPDPLSLRVKMDLGHLLVRASGSHEAEKSRLVRDALIAWYRERADDRLPERAAIWAHRFGIKVPPVLVSEQRRRWGSCNQVGEVRLNWRIIQAPWSLVDYVIAHELVHTVRGDEGHSAAFWAQLGRVMPDYDARKDALRALGPSLEW